MNEGGSLRTKLVLLYGSPFLTAAVSVALIFAAKQWISAQPLLGLLFPFNAALAAAGAAISGVIGRENPGSRFRGAIDCGAFGLITHAVFAVALVVVLNELRIEKYF